MAKNRFEEDLDLLGISKLVSATLESLTTPVGSPIATKTGGLFFNTVEKSISVNIDGSTWLNTVLFTGGSTAVDLLAVFTANQKNQIKKLTNSTGKSQIVCVDAAGTPYYVNTLDFDNFLDSGLKAITIEDDSDLLATGDAVYEFVTAAIATNNSKYLPLAGGTMTGDIIMSGSENIQFNNVDNYISGSTTQLNIIGKSAINLNVNATSILQLTTTALKPYLTNTIDLGTTGSKYKVGYFEGSVNAPLLAYAGNMGITATGGTITLTGNGQAVLLSTAGLYPNITNTTKLGDTSKYWSNTYSTIVTTGNIVLSGATALTSVDTTIDSGSTAAQIPTALAVWNLFATIEDITGTTITDMEDYGMVARYTGINPENYLLQADNTWINKTSVNYWTYDSGTYTLGLNTTDLDIAKFEFIVNYPFANNVLAMGVRGNYTFESIYSGANVTVYIGDIGSALLTDRSYNIEVVSDLRTRDSIYFGGANLTDDGTVSITNGLIGAVPSLQITNSVGIRNIGVNTIDYGTLTDQPTLDIDTAILNCAGISTDGTNVWAFKDVGVGAVTPSGRASIEINGDEYFIAVQIVTP